MSSIKRTTVNLDTDLVREAAATLGTTRTTDTLHQAMREVVLRDRRARLAQRDLKDLTLESLERLRKPR